MVMGMDDQEPKQSLIRPNNDLQKTEQLSLTDLALLQCLDQMAQIYKTELLPGETRVWRSIFCHERPDAIRWGFRKYFQVGTFPAKPADIANLIREKRASPYFDGWDADIPKPQKIIAREEYRKRATESREEFFKSPEYQQFLERMKREHGI